MLTQITVFSNENFVWCFYCSGLRTLFLCFDLTFRLDVAVISTAEVTGPLGGSGGLQRPDLGALRKLAHSCAVKACSCVGGALGTGSGGQRLQDRSSGELTRGSGLGPSPLLKFAHFSFIFVYAAFSKHCLFPLDHHACCVELSVELPCS